MKEMTVIKANDVKTGDVLVVEHAPLRLWRCVAITKDMLTFQDVDTSFAPRDSHSSLSKESFDMIQERNSKENILPFCKEEDIVDWENRFKEDYKKNFDTAIASNKDELLNFLIEYYSQDLFDKSLFWEADAFLEKAKNLANN